MILFTPDQVEHIIRNAYLAGHTQGDADARNIYWNARCKPVLESLNDYLEKWESEAILVQPPSAPASIPDLPT